LAEPAPVSDLGNSPQQRLQKLEQQFASRGNQQVQLQQSVDSLQQEVNELRGALELQAHQLDQILRRQRELYQELERRVSARASASTARTAPTAEASGVPLSESDAYKHALDLILKQKRFAEAIPVLQNFIKTYPNSSYSANAHYWLGQLLFNSGDRSGAKGAFNTVVTKYADSPKVSDAVLKLGMIEQLDGNPDAARSLYQRVVKDFPDSASAQIARARLDALK
jgi:tol-pal system protein YbgF